MNNREEFYWERMVGFLRIIASETLPVVANKTTSETLQWIHLAATNLLKEIEE